MLVLRWLIVVAVGAGMSQAYRRSLHLKRGRPRLKDFEDTFSMLKDQIPNFPKDSDVTFQAYPDFIASRNNHHHNRKASPEEAPPDDCTAYLTELLPSPSSSYPIEDQSFSVTTPNGQRRVLASCDDLKGLGDFERVERSSIDDRRGGGCLFKWSGLWTTCAVSTDLDGLRDHLETLVRFDSLYLEVKRRGNGPEVNVGRPVLEKLFKWFEEGDLRSLSEEEREKIQLQLSTRIQGNVNSEVANLLKDLVREGLASRGDDLMCRCAA